MKIDEFYFHLIYVHFHPIDQFHFHPNEGFNFGPIDQLYLHPIDQFHFYFNSIFTKLCPAHTQPVSTLMDVDCIKFLTTFIRQTALLKTYISV